VRIAGVTISNPDKVWWPDEGITKADVARFYDGLWRQIAPWMRDRPLTAERCPDGMRGGCFYQKDFAESGPPAGAPRLSLRAASTGKVVRYLVGGARATLVGMVNLGCIAVHVMSSRASRIREVDWLAFDLDPPESFADAARAGLALRRVLDEAGLVSYPKTSGSRGLHVFIPLRAGTSQQRAVAFATETGAELARREPKLVTVEHSKAQREGRVFADAFRNAYTQTIGADHARPSRHRSRGTRSHRGSTPRASTCAPSIVASPTPTRGRTSGECVGACEAGAADGAGERAQQREAAHKEGGAPARSGLHHRRCRR
jgi:bifunctional non-homologous end joining protein LigD